MNPAVLSSVVHCIVGCNVGSPDLQALHVLECNTETGEAKIVQSVKGIQGTTYFQVADGGKTLVSSITEEIDGKKRGVAVSFALENGRIGKMTRLATLTNENPCYVAVSPDGKTAGYAAYVSATASTVSLADGSVLGCDIIPDDATGPDKPRQEKAHAHCAFFTPDGTRMGIVDLGCDRIRFYDPKTMALDAAMTIRFDPGDGPRHAIWSHDHKYLFVISELGNFVTSFAWDGQKTFTRVGKWSTLPAGCKDWSKASAIKLTADGKVLMASNRGHDSIAFFDVNGGELTLRNVCKIGGVCPKGERGIFPRDFELMPGEKFMVVGRKKSNEIQVFAFDRAKLEITPVGAPISAWLPLCFKFL